MKEDTDMGAVEEGGKVVTSTIEAMKSNPSCLAAIILAGIFAVLTFFALQRDADRRSKTTDLLLERCLIPQNMKAE